MAQHDMDSADLRDAYEDAHRGFGQGHNRVPNAVRTHTVNGVTEVTQEFHLGHWERMNLSLAIDARIQDLTNRAAQARLDAVNLDADSLRLRDLLDLAATLEDNAMTLRNLDHILFQHADHVEIHRTDSE